MRKLSDIFSRIKSDYEVYNYDEITTRQVIILPILQSLGWDIFNRDEVYPEYTMQGRRVDYSLRIKGRNLVFLEIKKPSEILDKYERQLLEYSFFAGIRLACLSNGLTWQFYLPLMADEWSERKFYTLDLIEQDISEVEEKFLKILSREKIENGEAFVFAEEIFKSAFKKKTVMIKLPEAWNKIITEPHPLLTDLLGDLTERLSGFRPSEEEILKFLSENVSRFKLSLSMEKPVSHAIRSQTDLDNTITKSHEEYPASSEQLSDTAIHLKVSLEKANNEFKLLANHKTFMQGFKNYWVSDEKGNVKGQSVCWLYCWAKTGMGVPSIAEKSKKIFNSILDVSYEEFDKRVGLELARQLRYDTGNIENELKRLLGN